MTPGYKLQKYIQCEIYSSWTACRSNISAEDFGPSCFPDREETWQNQSQINTTSTWPDFTLARLAWLTCQLTGFHSRGSVLDSEAKNIPRSHIMDTAQPAVYTTAASSCWAVDKTNPREERSCQSLWFRPSLVCDESCLSQTRCERTKRQVHQKLQFSGSTSAPLWGSQPLCEPMLWGFMTSSQKHLVSWVEGDTTNSHRSAELSELNHNKVRQVQRFIKDEVKRGHNIIHILSATCLKYWINKWKGLRVHLRLLLVSEQSFPAAGGDLSQQMLVQMVYSRDVNQLNSGAAPAFTPLIKNLLHPNRITPKHKPPGYTKYKSC